MAAKSGLRILLFLAVWSSLASSQSPFGFGRLLEIDEQHLGSTSTEAARVRFEALRIEAHRCAPLPRRDRVECLVQVVAGGDGVTPVAHPTLETSSVAEALVRGRASCTATVGLVLALAEELAIPLSAYVLDTHVMVVETQMGAVFETLGAAAEAGTRMPKGRAITIGSDEYAAVYLDNLGARLADSGRTEAAERAFVEALAVAPSMGRARYNYGTFLLREGRNEEAIQELTWAIRRGWRRADALVNRAVAHERQGRNSAAREDLRRALAIEPGHGLATRNLRLIDGRTRR